MSFSKPSVPHDEKSRDEFRLMVETIPHLAWISGADGRDEYFNQRWYDYTQATPEEALGEGWLYFLHPDDRQSAQEIWDTAVRTGQPYEARFRLRNGKTGEYHWFVDLGLPLTDAQGRVLKWFGTYTDIDKQKQTEEALRQSRDAFRLLTEAIPQLVWIDRPDGSIEYANQRWYDYAGYAAGQTIEENWLSFYHPDDREKVLALWHTSMFTSQPFEVEARLREGKTGEYRWFLIRAVPLKTAYGRVWKWLGTSTDIHEKKRTEEALRASEVRFRRLVQSNIIGITIAAPDGPILEANDNFLSLLGYTREDLAAGRLDWTKLTPPEYWARDKAALDEELATGAFTPFETAYRTKTGQWVPVLVGGTLFRQEGSGRLEIAFVLDLTARKEIERQKDLSLSMTGHELKTPLAALRGTLQLAQRRMKRLVSTEEHISPEISKFLTGLKQSLDDSVRQIDVQTRLINDLLDVSRITARTLKLSLERCDLVSILRQTVEDLRVTVPERSLLLELPEQTTVTVMVDRDRISQVVTNYVTNATRYSSPEQPVWIGLTVQENIARVWVRDKGPGLSKEAQQEVWRCFYQSKDSQGQNGARKGLGLGLYISQTLISQHQGEVGVESVPGDGSTFWFTLPLAK